MRNANAVLAEEPAVNLTDKFIEFASRLPFNPDLTPENKVAQDMLFEAVTDTATRDGVDMSVAYCRVTSDIAEKLGTSRDQLVGGAGSALSSAVRKVAYRCGASTAPGWGGCK